MYRIGYKIAYGSPAGNSCANLARSNVTSVAAQHVLAQTPPRRRVQPPVDDRFRVEPWAHHGDKRAKCNQTLRLPPKVQLTQRIRADDEIEIRTRLAPSQFRQRVH